MLQKFQCRLLPLLTLVVTSLLLSACSSNNRYQMKDDKAPSNAPDVSKVENAHPRYEAFSSSAVNRTYTVLGNSYDVLTTNEHYKAKGNASWYGAKFHGHLTSNGETYDMYSMTAAHKSLPLPTYAKVTNLNNNKQVIVRINDRGPFHEGRIIDLSYAAAYKLDMLKTGTAPVEVEAIYIPNPEFAALQQLKNKNIHKYIQVMASKDKTRLSSIAVKLEHKYQLKSRIQEKSGLYRLQLGPIAQPELASKLLEKIKNDDYPQSYLIQAESSRINKR